MTVNLLTHNTSKTTFLLIGLKQQLSTINFCSFDIAHVLCLYSRPHFFRAAWNSSED